MSILDEYKGGFSRDVIQSKELREYILGGHPGGYIGSSNRPSPKTDRYLEQQLRKIGMGSRAIGIWLTSTSGRHLCDDYVTEASINKWIREYSPAKEVVAWQDPQHQGTLGSSMRLRKKYNTPEKIRRALHNIEHYGYSDKPKTPDFMKI
jgi:hypothetical protein